MNKILFLISAVIFLAPRSLHAYDVKEEIKKMQAREAQWNKPKSVPRVTVESERARLANQEQQYREPVESVCRNVKELWSGFKGLNVSTGTGSVTFRDEFGSLDESKHKEGCRVSLSGQLIGDRGPKGMEYYFQDNGWEEIPLYRSDGVGEGTSGHFKDPVFCLEERRGGDGSYIEDAVTCVRAIRAVVIR